MRAVNIKAISWRWALLFVVVDIFLSAIFGGWLSQARLDPMLALAPRMTSIALLVWSLRSEPENRMRWVDYGLAVALAFVVQMLLALLLSARLAWGQGLVMALISLPIFATFDWLVRWRTGKALSAILLAITAVILSLATALIVRIAYDSNAASQGDAERPRLAILTSLPIVWGTASTGGAEGFAAVLEGTGKAAPALVSLERRFDVTMLDAVDARTLPSPTDRNAALLLAHPRALAPAELVALDGWIRKGGKALILADALLVWEPPFALGDPRNPPITSLLTPMLDHWGLELALSTLDGQKITPTWDNGNPLLLPAAGRFVERREADGVSCTPMLGGLRVDCHIGEGQAILLSDADMLDTDYWLADAALAPQYAGAEGPALWRSGNLAWITQQLLSLTGRRDQPLLAPVWMGEKASEQDGR